MNDYFYKPKKNSLPKIPITESTTYYKTFYTNRSKNKGYSINNSYKLIDSNKNNIIFNSKLINKKKFLKTEHNSVNERLNENNIFKIKQFLFPKNDASEAETDDTIFALSEIRNMDKKLSKRVNKNLIWKEKIDNIYDVCTSKNKKDIKEIKEKVRNNYSGINAKLKKVIHRNKFLPKYKLETINDAQDIMIEIKDRMMQEKKLNKRFNCFNKIDLHTFTMQNRDICLKNIFIDLIRDESNKIKTKEIQIHNALEEAKNNFKKDKQIFEKFTANKKKYFREKEIQLEEAIKKNKIVYEQYKKCSSEQHGIKDEIDKNIRDIILFKTYANFIHQIIDKDENMEKVNMNKINLINNERDLDITMKNILEEFSFLLNEDYQLSLSDDLNNPRILTILFNNMESNIINSMEERDITIKEMNRNRRKYEKELENLKDKIESEEKELEDLYYEMDIQQNICSPKRDFKNILDENEKYLSIIYDELIKVVKQKKSLQNGSICSKTLNALHQIEDKLLILFDEMDQIEKDNHSDGIIKSIIDKVKYDNKIEKYLESREISIKQQEDKNKKYQQRMNRFLIRGPIIFPPPWAIKKDKEKNIIKKDIKKDDEEIIYY
jgi:hypothetical protein